MSATIGQTRAGLADRLRARREEIERAILTRVYGAADSAEVDDPIYMEGLRAAVPAALDYGLTGLEAGEERAPPVPLVLLAQARQAARSGVSLEAVMRRYFIGYALLGDFVIEESERIGSQDGASPQRLLRVQAGLFDRLLDAVAEEYGREVHGRLGSSDERRTVLVRRLLDEELLEAPQIAYDFNSFHLGAVAAGEGASTAIRDLAVLLDYRVLLVNPGDGSVWAWLGGRRPIDPIKLQSHFSRHGPESLTLAIGEPADGLGGWRRTHRQARAALPIALRTREAFVRYADVAVLASILRNDLLVTSLREMYISPLEDGQDEGELARQTLCAYFAAERNVSSAAAALGVTRQAVAKRLQAVEERIGRPLRDCSVDLEMALHLDRLDGGDT